MCMIYNKKFLSLTAKSQYNNMVIKLEILLCFFRVNQRNKKTCKKNFENNFGTKTHRRKNRGSLQKSIKILNTIERKLKFNGNIFQMDDSRLAKLIFNFITHKKIK